MENSRVKPTRGAPGNPGDSGGVNGLGEQGGVNGANSSGAVRLDAAVRCDMADPIPSPSSPWPLCCSVDRVNTSFSTGTRN